MKLVANKPCNLNGKKYFIGEEVPVEEVVDYASLVKMGLLSVIHDAVPEDNLEECVAMVGEVSFSIPIVKGHETIDLDVTEPQMQDAVKTMQMSADAAVAHIRGNIEGFPVIKQTGMFCLSALCKKFFFLLFCFMFICIFLHLIFFPVCAGCDYSGSK